MKKFREYSWWFLFVLILVLYFVKFGTRFFDEPSREGRPHTSQSAATAK